MLDGMLAVRAANQQLDLSLPERDGYTTIAGFLMSRAGRVLKTGEEVQHESGVFRVEKVEGRRVTRVRFLPAGTRSLISLVLYGLVLLFGFAASASAQVKRVEMHIDGYLCGN